MSVELAVVGGGSWGTAFADHLARTGHRVALVCRDAATAARIAEERENGRYLPGVALHEAVRPVADPVADGALAAAAVVVLAVPSRAFAAVAAGLAGRLAPDAVLLSLTKGLEPGTGRRLSEVAAEATGVGAGRVAVLSGPNHAEEIAARTPAATVVAAADLPLARRLRDLCSGPRLRAYANDDVVGVELAGAAKNVIAIATGVSDGLGYGDNARAALLTRGLAEMARLGAAFGADPRTFAGLAGLGDLVATCCSRHSRNRRAGQLLAGGVAPGDLEAAIGMVAEGLTTAPTVAALGRRTGLELPITDRVCAVLEGEPPGVAVETLMTRAPADEG